MIKKTCKVCDKIFHVKRYLKSTAKFCSRKCYHSTFTGETSFTYGFQRGHTGNKGKRIPRNAGENNYNWKGGNFKTIKGYVRTYSPDHPFNRDKYVLGSRLIAEQALERYLDPTEVVHHIDENKQNDTRENLFVFENESQHRFLHIAIKHWGLPKSWLQSNIA